MAETMNDAVSRLLPPQILSVDVVLMDKENGSAAVYKNVLNGTDLNLKPTLFFPSEFPYEFDSALSSPVDSVLESTKTKATSDEEEFLAGLTQRLTHSSTRKLEVHDRTYYLPIYLFLSFLLQKFLTFCGVCPLCRKAGLWPARPGRH